MMWMVRRLLRSVDDVDVGVYADASGDVGADVAKHVNVGVDVGGRVDAAMYEAATMFMMSRVRMCMCMMIRGCGLMLIWLSICIRICNCIGI